MMKIYMKRTLLYGAVLGIVATLLIVVRLKSKEPEFVNKYDSSGQKVSKSSITNSPYEKYFETVKRENETAHLIKLAQNIQRQYGLVMVTIMNDAFLPFSLSWMCNTQVMNIHHYIIYITTDMKSKRQLDSHWKELKSVYIPSLNLHGDQEYSEVGYVKMMNLRTQLLRLMLLHNITVFLFETDCVWLSNPLPDIFSKVKRYDMLLVQPTRGKGVLGGFMLLKPTESTVSLWTNLSVQMWNLLHKIKSMAETKDMSKLENDQVYFSNLIKIKYAQINVGYLSNRQYVDGKWYEFTDKERKSFTPILINNNWISGNKQKIKRAKKWGHWFLKSDNTCDSSQVSNITH